MRITPIVSAATSTATKTTNDTAKIWIEKISARVFCPSLLQQQQQQQQEISSSSSSSSSSSPSSTTSTGENIIRKKGGNPVTIFKILPQQQQQQQQQSSLQQQSLLTPEQCSKLATTCEWESVFVFPPSNTSSPSSSSLASTASSICDMAFYLPNGTPISFCAHAAMGGAYSYLQYDTNQEHQQQQQSQSEGSKNHNNNDDVATRRRSVQLNLLHQQQEPQHDTNQIPENDQIMQFNDKTTTTTTTTKITQHDSFTATTAAAVQTATSYIASYIHDEPTVDNNENRESHPTQPPPPPPPTTETATAAATIALDVQNIVWQQEPIQYPSVLHRIIRDYHQVNGSLHCTLPMMEILPSEQQWEQQQLDEYEVDEIRKRQNKVIPLPTFINSWIGPYDRKKTMIYINNELILQQQIVPPPPLASQYHYPKACDSIQNTSGLYFYTSKQQSRPTPSSTPTTTATGDTNNNMSQSQQQSEQKEIPLLPQLPLDSFDSEEDNQWECRQFPRQSGYPEDPATGVAAAALAISLQFCEQEIQSIVGYTTDDSSNNNNGEKQQSSSSSSSSSNATISKFFTSNQQQQSKKYEFYQGTAMGQPSYIVIDNIRVHSLESYDPSDMDDRNNNNNNNSNNQVVGNNDIKQQAVLLPPPPPPPPPTSKEDAIHRKDSTPTSMDDEDELDQQLEQESAKLDLFKEIDDDHETDTDDDELWDQTNDNVIDMDQHSIQEQSTLSSSSSSTTTTTNNIHQEQQQSKDYRFYKHRGIVSFTLIGRIEVDDITQIEI